MGIMMNHETALKMGEVCLTAQPLRLSFKERIAQVRIAAEFIPKRGHNDFHNYDYAQAGDVQGLIGKSLAEQGILIRKQNERVEYDVVKTAKGNEEHRCRLTVEYGLADVYSDEVIWYPVCGEGRDTGDKSYYKALTGSRKNFLIDSLCLGIGDDPEASGDEERETKPTTGKHKFQSEQPRKVVPNESQEPQVITVEQGNWLSQEFKRLGMDLQKALNWLEVDSVENLNPTGFAKLKEIAAKRAAEKRQQVKGQAQVINPR